MTNNDDKNLSVYKNIIQDGIIEAKKGNFLKSNELFLKAINIDPINHITYINLSNLHILQKDIIKSVSILENYIQKFDYNFDILIHYWKISIRYNLKERLNTFLTNILHDNTKKNNRYLLYFLLGKYNNFTGKFHEAYKYYNKCIENNSSFKEAHFELLDLYERTNRIEELEKILQIIFDTSNDIDSKTHYYKSLLLNRKNSYEKSQKIIDKNDLENKFSENKEYYIKILNLKSKNLEKLKKYTNAINTIKKRNIYLSQLQEYRLIKKENITNTVYNYKEIYNRKNLKHIFLKTKLDDSHKINLAFLVGFPRSGTTLLDTILRSHSNTHVLEEMPYIQKCRDKYFKNNNNKLETILKIEKNDIIKLRELYLNQIGFNKISNNKLIIDKLPLTMPELGFIKIIFPESKVIVAIRHPCDVILSCFFTYFKPNNAMVNFLQLEDTVSFYNNIFELFDYYEQEFNLNHIQIKYENVINNFNKEIKKLLKYLKLDFEEKIKNFYETAKDRDIISTPSYSQVVNPLYTSSIDKWKNYKEVRNFEKNLKKWIDKFNY